MPRPPREDPERIRVVHVLNELHPSGMERMLVAAGRHFRDLGIVSSVIGQGASHPYAAALEAAGYEVMLAPVRSSDGGKTMANMIQVVHPDVVHLHSEKDYLRTVLTARRAAPRAALVRSIHSVFAATGAWRWRRTAQAVIADRMVAALVSCGPAVEENERRFFRYAPTILNWVDDRFLSIESDTEPTNNPIAVIVGNCSAIKNHEMALNALLHSHVAVVHIGDERGATPKELALLEALGDRGLLIDRGVKDPASWLARAQGFFLPSTNEGFSIALAEAVVVGIPALVSDLPGIQWAAEFGVERVPLSDEEWRSATDRWRSATQHSRWASANDEAKKKLSASRGAGEYAKLYRRLVSKRTTGA